MSLPHGPTASSLSLLSPYYPPLPLSPVGQSEYVCVCVCVCVCARAYLEMPRGHSVTRMGCIGTPEHLRASHSQGEPHVGVEAGLGLETSPAPWTLHTSLVLGQSLPLLTSVSPLSLRVRRASASAWPWSRLAPGGRWMGGAPGTQASLSRVSRVCVMARYAQGPAINTCDDPEVTLTCMNPITPYLAGPPYSHLCQLLWNPNLPEPQNHALPIQASLRHPEARWVGHLGTRHQ